MNYVIDRFEENYAVVETPNGMKNINRELLPKDAKEGDSITEENGKYIVCDDDEDIAKRIEELQDKLFN